MNKNEVKKYIAFHEKPLTVSDLAKMIEWKDVRKAWLYHYSQYQPNKLKKVFIGIQGYPKRKQKDADERLEVRVTGDRDWDNGLVSKEQAKKDFKYFGFDEGYGCSTNKFSLSFRKWKEVSNLLVSDETIKNNTVPEIIAHFIWEITWYGMEGQMEKKGKEIFKSAKKCKEDIDKKKKNEKNSN